MRLLLDHIYIFLTIAFTACGQIIMKWQSDKIGLFPAATDERIGYFLRLLFNPWIISVVAAAFVDMLSWIIALGKFRLSYAYPFYSMVFIIVIFLSNLLFQEPITRPDS